MRKNFMIIARVEALIAGLGIGGLAVAFASKNTLENVGAPTTAKQIGLSPKILAKALTIAQELRPERYTILKEVKMTEKKAISLAKSTKVI